MNVYRIVVFRERTLEGVTALIRHELEHARQRDVHGQRLTELYGIAENMLLERVGGLPGSAFLYQVIPVEMDANASSALFVRNYFRPDRIDTLLRAGDRDGPAIRSLVGPPSIDTLSERMIRFFATMPDLGERFAARNDLPFTTILNIHGWRGAGDVYHRILEDDDLRLPR